MRFYLNFYLSKRCGAQRLFIEFPGKGWRLESVDSLLKRIRLTGTTVLQPGSGSNRKPYAQPGQLKKALISS